MTTGTEGPDTLANDQNVEHETVDALGGDDVITVRRPFITPVSSAETVRVNGGSGFDTIILDPGSFFFAINSIDASGSDVTIDFRSGSGISWILSFNSVERFEASIVLRSTLVFGDEIDILKVQVGFAGTLDTGAGNDEVRASGELLEPVAFNGGAGDDLVDLSLVTSHFFGSSVFGGDGDDILTGMQRSDRLDGGAGDDILIGYSGAADFLPSSDEFVGGSGNDTITGSATRGTDRLRYDLETGTAGALVNLSGSAATLGGVALAAGEARDTFGDTDTLTGIDHVSGNVGDDQFLGHSGANELAGGAGDDILIGDGGDDLLAGGADDDTLIAGTGIDRLQGGEGNDILYFGSAFTGADAADGGAGVDQLALQGDYALALGGGVTGIESLAILPGDDTRFGDAGANFYDYNITTQDVNVAAGVQLIVDANRLRPGEDFTFNGSAETDGGFFIWGGGGTDTLTGGSMTDIFYFGENLQFGASDTVNGGAGIDQLGLRGNYTIVFGAGQLSGIENIGLVSAQDTRFGALGSTFNYNLTMNDANVASGVLMTVDGAALRSGETLTFNGSAETDGLFRIFGGQGGDAIVTGSGNDIIQGGRGADDMTGGAGADTFRYITTLDSTAAAMDEILDFAPGTDKIDLSRIDASTSAGGDQAFSWIGATAFTGSGAASAGELRAYQSGGDWFVEGDTDGDGAADLVIRLAAPAAPVVQSDFLL